MARTAEQKVKNAAYARAYYRTNREKILAELRRRRVDTDAGKKHREYQRRRRATPEGWAQQTLTYLRAKCRRENLPFDLTLEDLVPPTTCPVTGRTMKVAVGARTFDSPSVDRYAPEKGYVKGNVEIICWGVNRLKNDCTNPVVFEQLAAYVRRVCK